MKTYERSAQAQQLVDEAVAAVNQSYRRMDGYSSEKLETLLHKGKGSNVSREAEVCSR